MKKSDLKTLIKPLVKECINEILIEEGLLANVVSEVVKGVQGNLVMEAQAPPRRPQPSTKSKQKDTGRKTHLQHNREVLST